MATRLEESITRAIGCEATAKPYRKGFPVLLDHSAADRLVRALGADMERSDAARRHWFHAPLGAVDEHGLVFQGPVPPRYRHESRPAASR